MPITIQEFLDNILRFGIEYYGLFPGLYRGIVTRNDDPQARGRIQAYVPTMQEQAPDIWIKPAFAGAGTDRGPFWPPEVKDSVFVNFAEGQPDRPECYFGGWYGYPNQTSEVPSELGYSANHPDIRGLVTRMGHVLLFSDAGDDERVELIWNKANAGDEARTDREKTAQRPGDNTQGGGTAHLKFKPDGTIEIQDNANPGQTITLDATNQTIEVADANGNKITLSASGVEIEAASISLGAGATEPVVKGSAWLQWAASHTHPTSWGPSGPPSNPPPNNILSQISKTK